MKSSITRARGAFAGGAAALVLALLGGCGATPHGVDWNRVSARDQHLYFPGAAADVRPLAIVTAGANGLVLGGGPAPAAEMVAQDGQVMLVTSERATALRANQTQSLGAGQVVPTPAGPDAQPK